MFKNQLTWKIFSAILLNDVADSFAQVFMKRGLLHAEVGILGVHAVGTFISKNASSPLLWLGIAIYAANFFLWIAILSRVDLSVAVPLGSTLYVLVPLFALIFLHERVSPLRWLGILFIIGGIFFISRSAPGVTRPSEVV